MDSTRRIFVIAGAALLALRFFAGARDVIGFGAHIGLCVAGVRLLKLIEQKWGERALPVVRYALLPLAILVLALNVFFAPQAILPFILAMALAGVSIPVWVEDRKAYTILIVTLALPVVLWCGYGVRHIAQVVKLRTLDASGIAAVRFESKDGARHTIVRDRGQIAALCAALRDLMPYHPSRSLYGRPKWNTVLVLRNGSALRFETGLGVEPEVTWVRLYVERYESRKLYGVLRLLPLPEPGAPR